MQYREYWNLRNRYMGYADEANGFSNSIIVYDLRTGYGKRLTRGRTGNFGVA